MKYIKYFLSFLFSLFVLFLTAQENDPGWLWAERGGSASGFNNTTPLYGYGEERIVDLAVDNDNNYYYLAEVAGYNFTLGGLNYNPGEYEFETLSTDASFKSLFIFSTDSEGDLRWYKTISNGKQGQRAASIGTDENKNIYVSGLTFNWHFQVPTHFDNDTIMPIPVLNQRSENNKSAFLIKYNQDGEFQWLQMPEEDALYGRSGAIVKTLVDNDGTTHTLAWLRTGNYFDNQFNVEEDKTEFIIIKYDSDGSLLSFIPLNMKPNDLYSGGDYNYQLGYDSNLDRYYIADTRRVINDNTLGIGDYGSDHNGFYLAAFDNQGELLWYQENQTSSLYAAGDLQLDSQGNIYFSGKFQSDSGDDSFAGYVFEKGDHYTIQSPFLFKLNPDGDLIWGTNALLYSPYPGNSIVIDGEDIYLGMGSLYNTWGDIEIPHPSGSGLTSDIAIMRFNAHTGEPQELIYDQFTPSSDAITDMALDQNGDLVVGGYFGSDLFYETDFHLRSE